MNKKKLYKNYDFNDKTILNLLVKCGTHLVRNYDAKSLSDSLDNIDDYPKLLN